MKLTLKDIGMTIWRSMATIIAISVLGAVLFAGGTYFFVKKEYTATAKLYVYNEKTAENIISSSDLAVSKSLVDTYLIIIKSAPVLDQVQRNLSIAYPDLTTKKILSYLSGSAINETEAFYISATCADRQLATDIISNIVSVAPNEIIRVVKAASVEIIEDVKLPDEGEYDWPIVTNTIIGFMIGLALSVGCVLISKATDTTIYGTTEITDAFTLPIIGEIPSQFQWTSGNRKKKRRYSGRPCVLTKDTPFVIEEAYRKTRSNIVYLPHSSDENCRTLIVTSALAAEGKSTFSINLSISLAQSGNKVLLIDGDMRKPKIARYLSLSEKEGLSEYLAGISDELNLLKYSENLHIVVSGKSTSYAAELLSTGRAEAFLKKSKEIYDYILIDSPPINEVSDPMVLAGQVTGYIMCAVAGYSDVEETKRAVASLEQIGAKILGFAIIGIDSEMEQYGRYKRYGKYSYRSYKYSKEYYGKGKYDRSSYEVKTEGKATAKNENGN